MVVKSLSELDPKAHQRWNMPPSSIKTYRGTYITYQQDSYIDSENQTYNLMNWVNFLLTGPTILAGLIR